MSFFWVHGGMNRSAEQTNHPRTASRFTRFVCLRYDSYPHEPRKKDTHSLSEIENTSARGLIQGGSRGVGPGVSIPSEICQRWGPVWRFNGKDNVGGGVQELCLLF